MLIAVKVVREQRNPIDIKKKVLSLNDYLKIIVWQKFNYPKECIASVT